MKKSNILISSAAALVALIAISGIAFSSFAADSDTGDTETAKMGRPFFMNGLSDETRQQLETAREAARAEMDAKRETVKAALEAGNYEDWAKAVGEDSPILEKINAGNFSRFAEAHSLIEQGRSIMEELGVGNGEFGRKGMRGPGGQGNMFR